MDHITFLVAVVIVTALGFDLTPPHKVCSGGILGAGLGRRPAEARWGTAGRTVIAWLSAGPRPGRGRA
ncbi:hypothetical protein [Streptomyces sp. NPDC005141]